MSWGAESLTPRRRSEGSTMGLFSTNKFENLEELLADQIEDLYDAEKQLTAALPEMSKTAKNAGLREAFESHLHETERQVKRLEEVFQILGRNPKGSTCEAMKGLVKEGKEMMKAKGDDDVRDAALIAAAQRIEHYEIAGYGTARTFANRLGFSDAARLLQETLNEEGAADKKLSVLAETSINWKASAQA